MCRSMGLVSRFSIAVIVWANLVAFSVSAQDVTQYLDYTRAICVESVGCMYTHLRDEALDDLFPDKERFTGIDQSLAGYWTLNIEVTRECSDDPDIHMGTYEMQIRIYEEEGNDQILLLETISLYYERIFYKIGTGIYVGDLEIGDATTGGSSTYFLVKTEDDLLRGISFDSTHDFDEDVYCYSNSIFTGIPHQP